MAFGYNAGNTGQGAGAIAIGSGANQTNQGARSVAIGYNAGQTNLGAHSVCVGALSAANGFTDCICIGAGATATGNSQFHMGSAAHPLKLTVSALGGAYDVSKVITINGVSYRWPGREIP